MRGTFDIIGLLVIMVSSSGWLPHLEDDRFSTLTTIWFCIWEDSDNGCLEVIFDTKFAVELSTGTLGSNNGVGELVCK